MLRINYAICTNQFRKINISRNEMKPLSLKSDQKLPLGKPAFTGFINRKTLLKEYDFNNSKEFIQYQYPTNIKLPLPLPTFPVLLEDYPNRSEHRKGPVKQSCYANEFIHFLSEK